MSRHRVKAISYDDDDVDGDYDEEDYCEGEEDAEAQKQLEIDTNEVIQRLRSGSPSVTSITKAEVQEALWHYYNDVEKSVNYLRSELYTYIIGIFQNGRRRLIQDH
jgi:elongation factor 1 alpha-like protein